MKSVIMTFIIGVVCCSIVFAEDLPYLATASKGDKHIDVCYGEFSREIELDISGSERDFDFRQEKIGAQLAFRPKLGWDLIFRIGRPKVELKYKQYKYIGDFSGYTVGAGFRYIFIGSGAETPEVSVLMMIGRLKTTLDEEKIKNIKLNIDTDLYATELSSTILLSKEIFLIKLYGGLNFYYADIDWKDNVASRNYNGHSSGVNIVVGSRFLIIPSVSLKIEGSFPETKSLWASLGGTF